MMARSTNRSNQRPDTLMQDRKPPDQRNLLRRTAGPYIRVIFEGMTMSVTSPVCLQLLPSWCTAANDAESDKQQRLSSLFLRSHTSWPAKSNRSSRGDANSSSCGPRGDPSPRRRVPHRSRLHIHGRHRALLRRSRGYLGDKLLHHGATERIVVLCHVTVSTGKTPERAPRRSWPKRRQ